MPRPSDATSRKEHKMCTCCAAGVPVCAVNAPNENGSAVETFLDDVFFYF